MKKMGSTLEVGCPNKLWGCIYINGNPTESQILLQGFKEQLFGFWEQFSCFRGVQMEA